MNVGEDRATTARLYATTDASVWAAEWCRIAREIAAADDGRQVIDEGWMIGWFANAIETAKSHTLDISRQLAADLIRLEREYGARGVHDALTALFPGSCPDAHATSIEAPSEPTVTPCVVAIGESGGHRPFDPSEAPS